MECTTCSKRFPAAEALHEHVGFFQSLAQYHLRELQKCLVHATEQSREGINANGMNDHEEIDDGNKDLHSDRDDEGDDLIYDDMRCPNPICKQLKEFETIKDLQRHYAIHIPCYEICLSCERDFDRASTYIHHKCKRNKRNPDSSVLRRRKLLRGKVDRELGKAKRLRTCEKQVSDAEDRNTDRQYKRHRTELSDPVVQPNPSIGCIANEADEMTSNNMQAVLESRNVPMPGNVYEEDASTSFNTFAATPITVASNVEISLTTLGRSSRPNATLLDTQTTCEPPYSWTTTKAPLMFPGTISKAPLMSFSTFSKAPLMYPGAAFPPRELSFVYGSGMYDPAQETTDMQQYDSNSLANEQTMIPRDCFHVPGSSVAS